MLAEELALKGIASLRFDKRGVGKSQSAKVDESDMRFEIFSNDVVGWVDLLKSDKRFSKIVLLGHSEGSLLCILAAQKGKVDGLVSVAGAGRPIDKIMKEQLKPKLPQNLMDESDRILDSLRMGVTVANVSQGLMLLYRPSVQPYVISWVKYDPAVELAKLNMPILLVQGTLDLQVPVEEAKILEAANPKARLLMIDNMNHILKECKPDEQSNLATYQQPGLPLMPGLVDAISDFVFSPKKK